ncbi:MAG: tetratricopeptide repeat protein [Gammaproteobacteria bacterium]|jgi:predicted negative regulator of RcsB-dependent stress response|nr:tetratricopeptide repeat protein [Gammaproteobacteria bacterium]
METEEEQVEKLKTWLKENGISIILGIVIGVGGIAGYNYWVHVQETTAAEASDHYSLMLEALAADADDELQEQANILLADYGSTEYALLAQLALARMHVDNADFEAAAAALQQVIGSAGQQPIAYLARTRLAAVQLQSEQYDQAVDTLAVEFPDQYSALVDELRGDALALQGKTAEAIDAYRKAQNGQPQPANPEFLRQKLNDLGTSG